MKIKKYGIVILIVVIASAICFGSGVLWKSSQGNEAKVTSDLISKKLTTINELATVDYIYTNMGKFEDVNNFYGWEVPFTKKAFIVSYDGEIKAGIDMKKVKVSVDDNQILIDLPEPTIFSHSIDNSSLQLFDEKSYLFNPLKIKDYTTFVEKEKVKVEKDAIENGLYHEADKKAREAITNLVDLFNTSQEEYKVVFQ